MFCKHKLSSEVNLFHVLSQANEFEPFASNRQGAILLRPTPENLMPIVRTTTSYSLSSQVFKDIHYKLIKDIQEAFSDVGYVDFNNAMVEIYDDEYTNMRWHSDQALDLADESYICLLSCYENANETTNFRKLKIKKKKGQEDYSLTEISLDNMSVVLFSTQTNAQHLHKIVLDKSEASTSINSRWLGITFRLSKTFVFRQQDCLYLYAIKSDNDFNYDNTDDEHHDIKHQHLNHTPSNFLELTFATEEERKEFCKHKSFENSQVGYKYPKITYTLSKH